MNKKYTMEEFKQLFDKALELTKKEIESDIDKSLSDGEHNQSEIAMFKLTNSLQNMLAFSCLKKNLFPKEK